MHTLRQTSLTDSSTLASCKNTNTLVRDNTPLVYAYSTDNILEVCSLGRDGMYDLYHRNSQDIPDINLSALIPEENDEQWQDSLSAGADYSRKMNATNRVGLNINSSLDYKAPQDAPVLAQLPGADTQQQALQPHLGSNGRHLWWANEVRLGCPLKVQGSPIPAYLNSLYKVAGNVEQMDRVEAVTEDQKPREKIIRPLNPLVRNNDDSLVSEESTAWLDAEMNDHQIHVASCNRKQPRGQSKLSQIRYTPLFEASDQTCAENEVELGTPHQSQQAQWAVRKSRKVRHHDAVLQLAVKYFLNYHIYVHTNKLLHELGTKEMSRVDCAMSDDLCACEPEMVNPANTGAKLQFQVYHEILLREYSEAHSVAADEESQANSELLLRDIKAYMFYAQYILFNDIPDERVLISQRKRKPEAVKKAMDNSVHMGLEGKYALMWLKEQQRQNDFPSARELDDNTQVNPGYLEAPKWLGQDQLSTNCAEPPENRKHITTNVTVTEGEQVSKVQVLQPVQVLMCNEDYFELSVLSPLRSLYRSLRGCASAISGYCRCASLEALVEAIIPQPRVLSEYCPELTRQQKAVMGTPCERLRTSLGLTIRTIEELQATNVTRLRDECVDADRELSIWLSKRVPINHSEELNSMQMAGDFPFDLCDPVDVSPSQLSLLRKAEGEMTANKSHENTPSEVGMSSHLKQVMDMAGPARACQFLATIKSGNCRSVMELLSQGVLPFSDDAVGLAALDYVSILDADAAARLLLHTALHLFDTMSVKDYTGANSYINNSYIAWGYDHINLPLRVAKHGLGEAPLQEIQNHADEVYQDIVFCLHHDLSILPSPETLGQMPISAYSKALALQQRLPKPVLTNNYGDSSPFSVLTMSPRREAFENWCSAIQPTRQPVSSFERLASLCRLFESKTEEPSAAFIPREHLQLSIRGLCNRICSSSLRRSVSIARPVDSTYVPPNLQELGAKSFIPDTFVMDVLVENARTSHYAMIRGLIAISSIGAVKNNSIEKLISSSSTNSTIPAATRGLCTSLLPRVQLGQDLHKDPNLRRLLRDSTRLGSENSIFFIPVSVKQLGNYMNHTRYRHWTAQTLAASGSNYKMIRLLANTGQIDLERPSGCGITALNCAVKSAIRAERRRDATAEQPQGLPCDDELGHGQVQVKGKTYACDGVTSMVPTGTPRDAPYKAWKSAAYLYSCMRTPRLDPKFEIGALGAAVIKDAQVKRGLGLQAVVHRQLSTIHVESTFRSAAVELCKQDASNNNSLRTTKHVHKQLNTAAMYQGLIHVARNALSSNHSTNTLHSHMYNEQSLAVLVTDLASVPSNTSWLCRKSTTVQDCVDALPLQTQTATGVRQYVEKVFFRVPKLTISTQTVSPHFPMPDPVLQIISEYLGNVPLTSEHIMTDTSESFAPSPRTLQNDANFNRLVPCSDDCECHCHCRFCC